MSYIVFARKWRPKTFDEIIGQDHVAQILKNAIKSDRVAHAYIFSGPRGVGKTSAARIFAKALNCEKGPAPEPCNSCEACGQISESRSLDVLEIDGASNRGIDEIRNLRENVKFAPAQGRYKIYIIDEVHMLTAEAFNALLKTLEEPPPHVKFIFATTQANKVLPTILSRCQRFDFRKISTKDIVDKLSFISKEEKLQVQDDALFAIARAADGSMRDAESILDQLSSFAGKKIGLESVNRVLGTLGGETLFEIADAVAAKDTPGVLKMVDELAKEGKDISLVALELLEHFRNLMIAKVGKNPEELIDLSEESVKRLSRQSANFTIEDLLYFINVLSGAYDMIRRSNMSRIPLEMAVIRITRSDSIRSLGEILKEVSRLEEKISENMGDDYVEKEPGPPGKEEPLRQPEQPQQPGQQSQQQPEETPVIEGDINLKSIEDIWLNVINNVKAKKISIASCLAEGEPVSYNGEVVMLGFTKSHSFHREVIEKPQNKIIVEGVISEILGKELRLQFTTIEARREPNNAAFENQAGEEAIPMEALDAEAEHAKDPIVGSALDIFKGRVVNNKRRRN